MINFIFDLLNTELLVSLDSLCYLVWSKHVILGFKILFVVLYDRT